MEDYARLPPVTRRYIVRALDFGIPRGDFMARWAGTFFDIASNLARADLYCTVPGARESIRQTRSLIPAVEHFVRRCANFDLQYEEMSHFVAFRFLYERLFGAPIRPFLASLYSAAASSPQLTSEARRAALAGITMFEQTEEEFSLEVPLFFPEWDGD